MQKWKASNLRVGEEVKIPKDLFVSGSLAVKNLISCKYVGETEAGILIDCFFKPSIGRKPEDCHYRKIINWSSIYCEHVKVYGGDGEMVRAQRIEVEEV